MHICFKKGLHSARRKNDVVVNRVKTTMFGGNSLKTLATEIWNSLPEDVKDLASLLKFAKFIKTCYGPEYKCNICKYSGNPYHVSLYLNFTP